MPSGDDRRDDKMMLCKNKKNKKIGQGKTKNDKSAIEKEIETGSWTNV